MSKAIEITDKNYEEVAGRGAIVLIDFWAEWCGPCKALGPTIDEIAEEYEGKVVVGKVNVDENPVLSQTYSIRSIPTLVLLKGKEVVSTQVGTLPKKKITEQLEKQLNKA